MQRQFYNAGADAAFLKGGGGKRAIEHSDRAEGEYDEYL